VSSMARRLRRQNIGLQKECKEQDKSRKYLGVLKIKIISYGHRSILLNPRKWTLGYGPRIGGTAPTDDDLCHGVL
jgi:hypothetical protein